MPAHSFASRAPALVPPPAACVFCALAHSYSPPAGPALPPQVCPTCTPATHTPLSARNHPAGLSYLHTTGLPRPRPPRRSVLPAHQPLPGQRRDHGQRHGRQGRQPEGQLPHPGPGPQGGALAEVHLLGSRAGTGGRRRTCVPCCCAAPVQACPPELKRQVSQDQAAASLESASAVPPSCACCLSPSSFPSPSSP